MVDTNSITWSQMGKNDSKLVQQVQQVSVTYEQIGPYVLGCQMILVVTRRMVKVKPISLWTHNIMSKYR